MYAVGAYGQSGIVLHYNGNAWTVLNTPSGFNGFLSVHGNGSEIYLGGLVEADDGEQQALGAFSSDLNAWQTIATAGLGITAIWTPRSGAALVGQTGGHFGETSLEIYSEGERSYANYFLYEEIVRSLFGDENGDIIVGMEGTEANGSRASVWRMTCE